ncbi:MAG: fibronectin type III domain-containing protein [Promethearchaeota archaeon]
MFIYQRSFPDEKKPFVQFSGRTPSTEAIITWETTTNENSVVWYGISIDSLDWRKISHENVFIHRVLLTGLKPDTLYFYRVGAISQDSGEIILRSSINSFRTAPIVSRDFQFIAYSDSQQIVGIGWHDRICKAIATHSDISFVADVGDLCQNWDYKPDWNQFFHEASVYMNKSSFVPCLGNHDGYYPEEESEERIHYYKQYFGTTTDNDRFYYSFEWGNTLFVIGEISTTSDEDPSQLKNIAHDLWLNKTLEKGQDKTFRILMFHRQLFSAEKDNKQLISRITPIVEKYNISLILYGHHHHYERFLHEGHTYICLGGGGGQQFGSNYFRPTAFTRAFAMGPSYTKISIYSEKINILTYSAENEIIDNCSLILNQNNAILLE